MRRIRVVETPHTPYTEWEMMVYEEVNIPSGEEVLLVGKDEVAGLELPTGDMMMFDNERLAVCFYDDTGRVASQTFYGSNEGDDIAGFINLKQRLLKNSVPLRS